MSDAGKVLNIQLPSMSSVGTFPLMQTWAGPSEVPGDAHGKGSWHPDISFTPHEESSFTKGSRKENVPV